MQTIPDNSCIDFSSAQVKELPFRHFWCTSLFINGLEKELFDWFTHTDSWKLTEAEFYTQYEFSLLDGLLPPALACLTSRETIKQIQQQLRQMFAIAEFELVDVTAHKLTDGHKIGVHNDYMDSEETHRLIAQINPGWTPSRGGFLMLFNSAKAEDVTEIIQPLNNSAFGFEISPKSYHAVSTVHDFSRFTVVYTFKKK